MRAKLPHLPKKAEQKTHLLDFETEDEADFYRGIQGMLVKRWRALAADSGGSALDRLRLMIRLRQISLHPQVYIESRKRAQGGQYSRSDWIDPSTKFNYLMDLVEAEKKPHRWILFCHFRDEMNLLADFLKVSDSISHIWKYNGDTKKQERTEILKQTHAPLNGKSQVLLVQLQAGGVGLNLQHFSRIAFTGPWWTAALMEQAIGRAVRIGQKEQVIVHHLILKEEMGMNIDKVMREKAEMKGKLCASVLEKANRKIQM
jgi:SNF2 family DNA or RNA helicase